MDRPPLDRYSCIGRRVPGKPHLRTYNLPWVARWPDLHRVAQGMLNQSDRQVMADSTVLRAPGSGDLIERFWMS